MQCFNCLRNWRMNHWCFWEKMTCRPVSMFGRRRHHLKRRSQTTDPLYSASRSDDDEALDRQQVPDAVVYLSTRSPPKHGTPASLCSYHRYFRSRTGTGSDVMLTQPPIYVTHTAVGDVDPASTQTSYPLLVHPASTLNFRSSDVTSPEVGRRSPTCFRSADNLQDFAEGDGFTVGRQRRGGADVVMGSIKRKRTKWSTTDGQEESSETENLCTTTINCS